jgi:hypothetical protein
VYMYIGINMEQIVSKKMHFYVLSFSRERAAVSVLLLLFQVLGRYIHYIHHRR